MSAVTAAAAEWTWWLAGLCLRTLRWTTAQLYAWLGLGKPDNDTLASSEERDELLAWVNQQLPDGQHVTNFGSDWSDGQRLGALVRALAPRAVPPDQQDGDQQPLLAVAAALRSARLLLKVDPTLTVMDVIWATDEQKMMHYLTKLRESATRLKKRFTLVKTPSFMAAADPAPFPVRSANPTRSGGGECQASGSGLQRAKRGSIAEFSVVFPRTSQPDLLLELRSDAGDFFTQRVTERSPPRLALADSLRTVYGTVLQRNIPVGYRVTGRAVTVTYRPPNEGMLEVSVVWRGHHVPGSPFTLQVEPGEPQPEILLSPPPEENLLLSRSDVVLPLGATLRPLGVLRELSREEDGGSRMNDANEMDREVIPTAEDHGGQGNDLLDGHREYRNNVGEGYGSSDEEGPQSEKDDSQSVTLQQLAIPDQDVSLKAKCVSKSEASTERDSESVDDDSSQMAPQQRDTASEGCDSELDETEVEEAHALEMTETQHGKGDAPLHLNSETDDEKARTEGHEESSREDSQTTAEGNQSRTSPLVEKCSDEHSFDVSASSDSLQGTANSGVQTNDEGDVSPPPVDEKDGRETSSYLLQTERDTVDAHRGNDLSRTAAPSLLSKNVTEVKDELGNVGNGMATDESSSASEKTNNTLQQVGSGDGNVRRRKKDVSLTRDVDSLDAIDFESRETAAFIRAISRSDSESTYDADGDLNGGLELVYVRPKNLDEINGEVKVPERRNLSSHKPGVSDDKNISVMSLPTSGESDITDERLSNKSLIDTSAVDSSSNTTASDAEQQHKCDLSLPDASAVKHTISDQSELPTSSHKNDTGHDTPPTSADPVLSAQTTSSRVSEKSDNQPISYVDARPLAASISSRETPARAESVSGLLSPGMVSGVLAEFMDAGVDRGCDENERGNDTDETSPRGDGSDEREDRESKTRPTEDDCRQEHESVMVDNTRGPASVDSEHGVTTTNINQLPATADLNQVSATDSHQDPNPNDGHQDPIPEDSHEEVTAADPHQVPTEPQQDPATSDHHQDLATTDPTGTDPQQDLTIAEPHEDSATAGLHQDLTSADPREDLAPTDIHQDLVPADPHHDPVTAEPQLEKTATNSHHDSTNAELSQGSIASTGSAPLEARQETNGQEQGLMTDNCQTSEVCRALESGHNTSEVIMADSEALAEKQLTAQNSAELPLSENGQDAVRNCAREMPLDASSDKENECNSLTSVPRQQPAITGCDGTREDTEASVSHALVVEENKSHDSTEDDDWHSVHSETTEDNSESELSVSIQMNPMERDDASGDLSNQHFIEPTCSLEAQVLHEEMRSDGENPLACYEVHFERISDDSSDSSSSGGGGGEDDVPAAPPQPAIRVRRYPTRLSPVRSSGEEPNSGDSPPPSRDPSPEGGDRVRQSGTDAVQPAPAPIGDRSLSIATRTWPRTRPPAETFDTPAPAQNQLPRDVHTTIRGQQVPGDVTGAADTPGSPEKSLQITECSNVEQTTGGEYNTHALDSSIQQGTLGESSETESDLSSITTGVLNSNFVESDEVCPPNKTSSGTSNEAVELSCDPNQDNVLLSAASGIETGVLNDNYSDITDITSANKTKSDNLQTARLLGDSSANVTISVESRPPSHTSDTSADAVLTSDTPRAGAAQCDDSNPLPTLTPASGEQPEEGRDLAPGDRAGEGSELAQPTYAAKTPRKKYSDLYADFQTPCEPRYQLHAEHARTKTYLGPALSRARPLVVMTEALPCVLNNTPPPTTDPAPTDAGPVVTRDDRLLADAWEAIVNETVQGGATQTQDELDTVLISPPPTPPPSPQPGGSSMRLQETPAKTADMPNLMAPAETLMTAPSGDRTSETIARTSQTITERVPSPEERDSGSFDTADDGVGSSSVATEADADSNKNQEERASDDRVDSSHSDSSESEEYLRRLLPSSKPPERSQAYEEIIDIQECSPASSMDYLSAEENVGDRSTSDAERGRNFSSTDDGITKLIPGNDSMIADASLAQSNETGSQAQQLSNATLDTLDGKVSEDTLTECIIVSKGYDANGNAINKQSDNEDERQSEDDPIDSDVDADRFSEIHAKYSREDDAQNPDQASKVDDGHAQVSMEDGTVVDETDDTPAGHRVSGSSSDSSVSADTVKAVCSTPMPRTLSSCSVYSGAESTDAVESLPDDSVELRFSCADSETSSLRCSLSVGDSEYPCSSSPVDVTASSWSFDTQCSRDSSKLGGHFETDHEADESSAVEEFRNISSESSTSETGPEEPNRPKPPSEPETAKVGKVVSRRTVYWAPGTPPPPRPPSPVGDEPVLLRYVLIDPDPIIPLKKTQRDEADQAMKDEAKTTHVTEDILAEKPDDQKPAVHHLVPQQDDEAVVSDEMKPVAVEDSQRQLESTPQNPEMAADHVEPVEDVDHEGPESSTSGNWLLSSSPTLEGGYVARIVRRHSECGGDVVTQPASGGRRRSPTNFSMEEAKKLLESGSRAQVKRQVEPRLEIATEGHVVRLRELFERFIESERSAGGRGAGGLRSSRSLASIPGSEPAWRSDPSPLETGGRSISAVALWRPVEIHTLEQQAMESLAKATHPASVERREEEEIEDEETEMKENDDDSKRDKPRPSPRVRSHRSLSCSAAEPVKATSPDINRAQFEAILRFFEGLRDGRIIDGASPVGGARAARSQAALGWLRRRWPTSGASGFKFDLGRAGLRRSLNGLPPPLNPPTGDDDDDGLADAEDVVLAPVPTPGPTPTPRVMTEYPYLSKRRSRPRLLARGLIPHQELVRSAQDSVVVFGPGLFHGTVGADNTFQLYVPEPQCAPRQVTVRPPSSSSSSPSSSSAATAATVASCQLRYLGYMYHEVRYRVAEPGLYRVLVTLGGHAADVDVMVRVT